MRIPNWKRIVPAIVIAVFLLTGAVFGVKAIADGKKTTAEETTIIAEETTTTAVTTEHAAVEAGYKFYNLDLQKDGDKENDFNFGYNRYSAAEKAAKKAGKTGDEKAEFIKTWLYKDFKKSIRPGKDGDPALAAAVMAYADSVAGTRFMGEFYDSAKEDWAQAINDAKEKFMKDKNLWSTQVEAFIKLLDDQAHVFVDEVKDTSDQMYQNPYTGSNAPDVIVMETDQNSGHYIAFRWAVKGKDMVIHYRAECGYQPTDVAEIMKITPTPKPMPEPTTTKPISTTEPTTEPTTTKPAPTTEPTTEQTTTKPTPTTEPTTEPTTTKPTPTTEPTTEPTTTKPEPTTEPTTRKEKSDDPANHGNADTGGDSNKPSDGKGRKTEEETTRKEMPLTVPHTTEPTTEPTTKTEPPTTQKSEVVTAPPEPIKPSIVDDDWY